MKEILDNKIKVIDSALSSYIQRQDNPQSVIYEAMRYSLFAGGKRLRPVIAMAVCEMCGGRDEAALPFACAVEMIHTYSLVHDDLPAMDNDALRRGNPTCHIRFDEATAILAGDALLNRAFEVMTDMPQLFVDAQTALKAARAVACAAGADGMIGGQIVDIAGESKNMSGDELMYMHRLKTGALIKAAALAGGIAAGASREELARLEEFACSLGMAFQIQDDVLDVTGDEQILGKPVGSDEKNKKSTYVKAYGLEQARKMAADFSGKAIDALDIFGEKAGFLIWLVQTLINRIS